MSSFFKRLISQRLARHFNRSKARDLGQLENKIFKVIHVQSLKRKTSSLSPQFAINTTKLCALEEDRTEKAIDTEFHKKDGIKAFCNGKWLSIHVDQEYFAQKVLEDIRSSTSEYGALDSRCEQAENVCVEYSSPNIAKPFHVGHLRSTIIGNVLANMYEATGHNVTRVNFLGDWGTQFGLLSLGLMRYADLKQLKADPLLELFNIYVKTNQEVTSECGKASEVNSETYKEGMALFTRLENGDEALQVIWKMVNDLSVAELSKMYERLGVRFTHVMAESSYQKKTAEVLSRIQQAGLMLYGEDGVGYVQIPDEETLGRASVVKSDGSSLYLTRDIASAIDRQEKFSLDKMHYVVDQGQRSHFIKLAYVLEKLNVSWASRSIDDLHVRFGRVLGMSTRKGNVVFLRDVLDEARARVIDSMKGRTTTRVTGDFEQVADIVGVTCIILQDLKTNRTSDYNFSWSRALNLKADSGIFVQYCHARLCNMLSGCGVFLTDDIDVSIVAQDGRLRGLILHMARYPDVFSEALQKLEPHHIVQYLFKLCHLINTTYAACPVKGQDTHIAQARLLVFECARQVLANNMNVLGLQPLENL